MAVSRKTKTSTIYILGIELERSLAILLQRQPIYIYIKYIYI